MDPAIEGKRRALLSGVWVKRNKTTFNKKRRGGKGGDKEWREFLEETSR